MFQGLKKFGLNYCDLQTMISNVSVFLRLLVINIDKRDKNKIPLISYIVTFVASACYFYVYCVSMVWFVFWRCAETGDTIAGIVVFSLGVASEIATFKLLYMYMYSDTIRDIVEGYITLDREVVPGSRKSFNLTKSLRVVKKRAILFWCVIVMNGFVYFAKAVILPGRHVMEDSFIFLGLEPMFETPNYQVAFAANTMGVFFTCYLTSNISAFFIIIAGYTEAQMLAISEDLIHLWDDANNDSFLNSIDLNDNNVSPTNKVEILNKNVNKRLIEIIKCHTMNIDLLKKVENVFQGAIAIEFFILIVSLIAELLGGLENTYLQLPFALMQVAMDCITGQRLMDSSSSFALAVYDSKWEYFDVKNAKIVLLMLQNAQKTLKLSAGGITMLSVACLMSVLRSIYSAYTTLRTTMN
ncbi:uncharacterized protein LOC119839984 [Zerene cesonia]|uniref:uncharacterized protein LOC119839984 n=1 Tax=Zerene cesonia TaxID=33412 RepID=UPI0018E531E7|nr:uncharacterized protein LOC119839984 [Zerene cesonia]